MRISKIKTAQEAVSKIKNGDYVMVGGFGLRGCPFKLISALAESGAKNLTIISNDLGNSGEGLGMLLKNRQIKALIGNYYTWNPDVSDALGKGEITVKLMPQGNFAEAIRAGGVGIPAFYTRTSAGTELGKGKEIKVFDGREYILEYALKADVALIKAYKADTIGNLIFYKTSRNFNPVMAMASDYTIVETERIVDVGELNPECIVTPHVLVDALVMGGDAV